MIPKIVHFCFGLKADFGGKPFGLVHYLAVKSAAEVIRPTKILMHYGFAPDTEWWQKALPYLTLNRVEIPESINGVALRHVAHMADVVRLSQLWETGGIYLDLDTICVKSFDPLLHHEFVIGHEGEWGLCNAVILAAPRAKFTDAWIKGYSKETSLIGGFREGEWSDMSIYYPKRLAAIMPDCVTMLDGRAFHHPCWNQLDLLFRPSTYENSDAYCHHLWEQLSWEPFIRDLTVEKLRSGTDLYSRMARKFLSARPAEAISMATPSYFTQRLAVRDTGADRMPLLRQLVAGKRVLHIGCCDSPIFNPESNLHLKLASDAALLAGCDIDLMGLTTLARHHPGPYFHGIDKVVGHWDLVLVPEVLEHLPNAGQFVERLFRLKADSWLITVPHYGYSATG